jgi:hypothetical protein
MLILESGESVAAAEADACGRYDDEDRFDVSLTSALCDGCAVDRTGAGAARRDKLWFRLRECRDALVANTEGKVGCGIRSRRVGLIGHVVARPLPTVQEMRAKLIPEARTKRIDHAARLCFVIDATESRARTWKTAQKIQAQMFRVAQ